MLFRFLLATMLATIAIPAVAMEQPHEQIEWTWSEFPKTIDPSLPNILLQGDSITRAYYPLVVQALAGRANIFLFATSASVGDVRLIRQIRDFSTLSAHYFAVIHFNNGMHGWGFSEMQYKAAFPTYVAALQKIAPGTRLIWASTTSVKNPQPHGASENRIRERNAIALDFVEKNGISFDDQNQLMHNKNDLYQDDVHFTADGAALQAEQVVISITAALKRPS